MRAASGGLAALAVAAGLLLAFGAVAQGGGSARDAGYPSEPFDIHIDSHPPKVQFATAGPTESEVARAAAARARFRFHATYAGTNTPAQPSEFYHYECKRDGRRYRRCGSPKVYRRLGLGRHVFRVKYVYQFEDGPKTDQSVPAAFRWRIKQG